MGAVFVVPSHPVLVSRRVYATSHTLNDASLCHLASNVVATSVMLVSCWSNASVNYHLAAHGAGPMYVFCDSVPALSDK